MLWQATLEQADPAHEPFRHSEASVSIAGRSPALEGDCAEVVVTVPTFRRPQQLLATLDSLAAQQTTRRFAVIVMENDAEAREGAAAALPLFETGRLPGMVIIAHQRGNCCAYNAGWETALRHFPGFRHLLVIDDDEIADPQWLERMCRTAETLEADIVGGPQVPVFARPEHDRWATHPVFAPPYTESGRVKALYSSGNLLIGRHVLAAMGAPFLDLKFNFMGGGDSDFLSRAAQRGFKLAWCAEAPVYEAVPERRRGGRLDPRTRLAQRRHLDAGGEEEARRHAAGQHEGIFEKPGAACRLAGAGRICGWPHRLAFHRALPCLCGAGPGHGRVRICQ